MLAYGCLARAIVAAFGLDERTVRAWLQPGLVLAAFDGLKTYINAFRRVFCDPRRAGRRGRPRLAPWPDVALVQVIKRRVQDTLTIERRIAPGCLALVERLLAAAQNGGLINTPSTPSGSMPPSASAWIDF
mgnify:CR=1 FL=1